MNKMSRHFRNNIYDVKIEAGYLAVDKEGNKGIFIKRETCEKTKETEFVLVFVNLVGNFYTVEHSSYWDDFSISRAGCRHDIIKIYGHPKEVESTTNLFSTDGRQLIWEPSLAAKHAGPILRWIREDTTTLEDCKEIIRLLSHAAGGKKEREEREKN